MLRRGALGCWRLLLALRGTTGAAVQHSHDRVRTLVREAAFAQSRTAALACGSTLACLVLPHLHAYKGALACLRHRLARRGTAGATMRHSYDGFALSCGGRTRVSVYGSTRMWKSTLTCSRLPRSHALVEEIAQGIVISAIPAIPEARTAQNPEK